MNTDFLSALKQIERERNIPMDMLLRAIEDALVAAYKRNFGPNQNVIIEIDRSSGELHIWQRKIVVPEVEEAGLEMSLEEAQEFSPEADIGMEIDIEVPNDTFGRIAAQTAKQVIVQRIREAEREIVYGEYVKREGELISGTVQRYEHRSLLVDLGRAEGVIPPNEQAHNEWFRQGDRIRAYVMEVKTSVRGPQVVLSRAQPGFLVELFKMEVPEIRHGIIQVKAVVREAGFRSKIAVKSLDSSVDPVGACVGPKGSRVQAVVDELRGEKIDVIPFSEDPITLVANSLQPARVLRVTLYEEERLAFVVVPDSQLSLAIGKEGQNARLAAKLTGWKIDIKSESQARDFLEQEAKLKEAREKQRAAQAAKEAAEAAAAPPKPAAPVPEPVAKPAAVPAAVAAAPAPPPAPVEEEEVIDMKTVSPDYFEIADLQEVDEEGYVSTAPVGIDPKEAFSVVNVLGKADFDEREDGGPGGKKRGGRR
jgi:transcription termination/antitermination protein NusA